MTFILAAARLMGVPLRKVMTTLMRASGDNLFVRLSEIEIGRERLWGDPSRTFSENNLSINWSENLAEPLYVKFADRASLFSDFPELEFQPYVCLHVRTGGFFNDDIGSEPRNAKIEDYFLAIDELVRRGYLVVRIGDPAMPSINRAGVIDYAHHPKRSEFYDVCLVEHCDFYIGSLSGPIDMACLFEKKILTVNCISLSHSTWYREGSRCLPKKVRLNGCLLPIKEQIAKHIFEIFGTGYTHANVEFIDNTPDEILTATLEFLEQAPLTALQRQANYQLQVCLNDYFETKMIWPDMMVDQMQKSRWIARANNPQGSICQFVLEKEWA